MYIKTASICYVKRYNLFFIVHVFNLVLVLFKDDFAYHFTISGCGGQEVGCGHGVGCGHKVGCGHEVGCGCEVGFGREVGCGCEVGCGREVGCGHMYVICVCGHVVNYSAA